MRPTPSDYRETIAPGETRTLRLRLSNVSQTRPFHNFDRLFAQRQAEADEFYTAVQNPALTEDECRVQRQALAGMLWSKQLFYYDIEHEPEILEAMPDFNRRLHWFINNRPHLSGKAEAPAFTPGITLDFMAKHALDFWLTTEDLPDQENRVTVNREGKITLEYRNTNAEAHKRGVGLGRVSAAGHA